MLLTFLVFSSAFAQQFVVEGEVVHSFGEDVENIHVFNTATSRGTLTNIDGEFTIAVSIGDTLIFSAVQFQKETLVISLEHYVSKKVQVRLTSSTNELDEILIRKHNLSGILGQDAKNIETKPYVSALSLGIIEKEIKPLTQSERRLYTATSGGGTIALDPIINAITGRTKMLKERIKKEKDEQIIQELLSKFPEGYLIKELHIAKESVYEFLYFCEAQPGYSTVMKKDEISILHFLTKSAEAFNKLKTEEE